MLSPISDANSQGDPMISQFPRQTARRIIFFILFVVACLLYVHPAERLLFSLSQTTLIGDGTDIVPAPYFFDRLKSAFTEDPRSFLYGAVLIPDIGAPTGSPAWYSGLERILITASTLLVGPEQSAVLYLIILQLATASLMYFFCRRLHIHPVISFGLALAWAFCPYTRARAKVHLSLAGTFHWPLALILIQTLSARRVDQKTTMFAVVGFLGIAMLPFYYLAQIAFFFPLLVFLYLALSRELAPDVPFLKVSGKKLLLGALCAIPALFWITVTLKRPTPSTYVSQVDPFAQTLSSHPDERHPFLSIFFAHPIDYLSGDVGIGPADPNPIKEGLNERVYETLGPSNPHERAHGVRWTMLLALVVSLLILGLWRRSALSRVEKVYLYFFLAVGTLSFWLSLSPDLPFNNWGLSNLMYKLFPQIRVPNRASLGVHFAVLASVGICIQALLRDLDKPFLKRLVYFSVPLAVFFEFPPLMQNLPTSPLLPKFSRLTDPGYKCGSGLTYPYLSGSKRPLQYYYFLQKMRTSDCDIFNRNTPDPIDEGLFSLFPSSNIQEKLQTNFISEFDKLKRFTSCSGTTWIVFTPEIPVEAQKKICSKLGWSLDQQGVCLRESPQQKSQTLLSGESALENCIASASFSGSL